MKLRSNEYSVACGQEQSCSSATREPLSYIHVWMLTVMYR